VSYLLIVHPQTVAVAAAVDEDSESVLETPKTLMRSPAADDDDDAGVRDVEGRTACGRRRSTRAATAAPACSVCNDDNENDVDKDADRQQRG